MTSRLHEPAECAVRASQVANSLRLGVAVSIRDVGVYSVTA